jgi:C_GCAxxG_C_C family probable redox protein
METDMNNAVKDFLDGYLCSEAIVKNFIKDETLLRASSAFGAGIAYGNSLCGALSGGILALSAVQGRASNNEGVDKLFEDIAELRSSFEKKFGSTSCSTLLGFNLTDSDGGAKFEAGDCKNQKCAKYIEFISQKVEELLNKDKISS